MNSKAKGFYMRNLFVFFVLLLVSSLSFAEVPAECDGSIKCIQYTWAAPTQRTDGTTIAPNEITRYDFHHTANNTFQGVTQIAGNETEFYLIDVESGNHTATIRAVEGDILGVMSGPASAAVVKAQIGAMTLTIQIL
jgi:hypothetical protein